MSFASEKISRGVLFWGAAAVLLLVQLGAPSLRGSEDRFAEITRAMMRDGDFFHPMLNGESHFHKPLVSYWAIAGASRAVGVLDELAARLPSAVAGALAAFATISLGRTLWGAPVGRLAGWILISTYGFLFWSRTAAADMENLAAVIVAVAWFRRWEERESWWLYVGFALICGVGAQAKGLAAIVLPLVVLAPHVMRAGLVRVHLRPGPVVLVSVTLAFAYLGPFVAAEWLRGDDASLLASLRAGDPRSGLFMVFQENVQRFYAPHDHRGPVYTYLLALPVLCLPWSMVLGASFVELVRARRRLDPETRWLLWAIVLVFALFTASSSRRSYYILPILPFCAIAAAVALSRPGRTRLLEAALRWTSAALGGVLALGWVAGVLAMPLGALWRVPVPPVLVVATLALAALGSFVATRREGSFVGAARATGLPVDVVRPVILAVAVFGGYFVVQYPALDGFRTEKPFAVALRSEAGDLPPARIAFVRHVPALFPFYLDAAAPMPALREPEEVRAFVAGGPGWIVASPRSLSRLGSDPDGVFDRAPALSEALYPWSPQDERLSAWRIGDGAERRGVLSDPGGG